MAKPVKKKKKKLVSMAAHKAFIAEGNHGSGKADPTKPKPAGPSGKPIQIG